LGESKEERSLKGYHRHRYEKEGSEDEKISSRESRSAGVYILEGQRKGDETSRDDDKRELEDIGFGGRKPLSGKTWSDRGERACF